MPARKCGKGPVRRLMSSPAIQFKGTGWYITDYAQKGKSNTPATGSGETKKNDSSSGERPLGLGRASPTRPRRRPATESSSGRRTAAPR